MGRTHILIAISLMVVLVAPTSATTSTQILQPPLQSLPTTPNLHISTKTSFPHALPVRPARASGIATTALSIRGGAISFDEFATSKWATEIIPAAGAVLANLMFLTPLKAVLRARREGRLGHLNPIPFPTILANCIAWLAYSFTIKNSYVFFANALGSLLGLFFTLTGLQLSDSSMRVRLEGLTMTFMSALVSLAYVLVMFVTEGEQRKLIAGLAANSILVLYYGSPLSALAQIIKTGSAASLHLPSVFANFANGMLWTLYGLAMKDKFISIPNGVGTALAIVQLVVYAVLGGNNNNNNNHNNHNNNHGFDMQQQQQQQPYQFHPQQQQQQEQQQEQQHYHQY